MKNRKFKLKLQLIILSIAAGLISYGFIPAPTTMYNYEQIPNEDFFSSEITTVYRLHSCPAENGCCGAQCGNGGLQECCETTDCICLTSQVGNQIADLLNFHKPLNWTQWQTVTPEQITLNIAQLISTDTGIQLCPE